ncbi:hypothetical protein MLD38_024929 [Melastoma candidum]|uniref:Uncharacterized protein n=1 Tax=Melastoma candidum TaxID=119954 RepID=A0ACB9P0M6_9MYRT|nr:hypothetical protein MLD38_024929 [Melastoma candidum]
MGYIVDDGPLGHAIRPRPKGDRAKSSLTVLACFPLLCFRIPSLPPSTPTLNSSLFIPSVLRCLTNRWSKFLVCSWVKVQGGHSLARGDFSDGKEGPRGLGFGHFYEQLSSNLHSSAVEKKVPLYTSHFLTPTASAESSVGFRRLGTSRGSFMHENNQYGEDALKEGMGGGGGAGHDPFDIFQTFFGGGPFSGGGGSSRSRRQRRGEDVIHPLKVSLTSITGHPRSWHSRNIQKGSKIWGIDQKIKFPGEADEAPDTITGDIVFIIQQKEHPKFKRKGDDLFLEHTLSLTESLCSFQFVLTHLDGRQLLIKSQPGEVSKPDQFKGINGEGMPIHQRSFMKGKLYLHFAVVFPDSISPDQSKALKGILPFRQSMQLTDMELDECEETTLQDVNMEEEMRCEKHAQAQEAYDEDEDDDMQGGAQRVQQ